MMITTIDPMRAFLWSFVLGLVITAGYFAHALFLSVFRPSRIFVAVSDFLFGNMILLFNFLYASAMTEGKIRAYTVFPELLVFFIGYFLLLRPCKRLIAAVVEELQIRLRKSVQKPAKTVLTIVRTSRTKKKTKSEKKT